MSITTTTLTRAAGLCAVAAGLVYIGVQVNHPHLSVAYAGTTDYAVRQTLKVVMAVLSLVGITGMYLRQVQKAGVLGLVGYLVYAAGYLVMMGVEFVGAFVLPTLTDKAPGYVTDLLTVAFGGTSSGDIGAMRTAITVMGLTYLAGGFLFGLGLFRAHVLARWAAALLALGNLSTIAIKALPEVNERLFAIPTGVALIGLGWSLWHEHRAAAVRPITTSANTSGTSSTVSDTAPGPAARLDPAGTR